MVNQQVIDVIVNFSSAPSVWVHEKVICRSFKPIEGVSPHKVLTIAMASFKRGYFLDKRKKIAVTQGRFDDLSNLHMQKYGKIEEFSLTQSLLSPRSSASHVPRWFFFGFSPTPLKRQLEIVRTVIGEGRNNSNEHAKQNWKKWYEMMPLTRSYLDLIESICSYYKIEKTVIRQILFYSNFYEGKSTRSATISIPSQLKSTPTQIRESSIPVIRTQSLLHDFHTAQSPTPPINTPSPCSLPTQLQTRALKLISIQELAFLEACLSPNTCNLVTSFSPYESESIRTLNSRTKTWARKNIEQERADRLQNTIFKPKQEQLLIEWLDDGLRYSFGERLPRNNLEIHPVSRNKWFSDKAFACIRHIIFSFNIPTR